MSVNLPSRTPIIKDWVSDASAKLCSVGISSAKLDAELILAAIIKKDRTFLHGHADETIDAKCLKQANKYLNRRINHEPLAYILGYKEFFGHEFIVSPKTLIPRPESEDLIEILNELPITDLSNPNPRLVDIGTGSGCLGISAKLTYPQLEVTLADIDLGALKIASKNARKLGAKVKIIKSDLIKNYNDTPDIIVANLPYVDRKWLRSPETDFEPSLAIFSSDNGLYLIKKLISSASQLLSPGKYLIIEADPRQHSELTNYANKKSFETILRRNYVLVFKSY